MGEGGTSEQLALAEVGTDLVPDAQQELHRQEAIIERAQRAFFFDVGTALLAIRDGRLYRSDGFGTFEEYCRARWGFERRHAYRLIDAARVVGHLETCPTGHIRPTSERQVRPLTRLEPEQQREAWAQAVAAAPGDKVTGAHVARAVEIVKGGVVTHSIKECGVCGNLYDADVFPDACPYCRKKSRGLPGWVEGQPEMMRASAEGSKSLR